MQNKGQHAEAAALYFSRLERPLFGRTQAAMMSEMEDSTPRATPGTKKSIALF